jgi:hypothetical protein
MLAKWNTPKNIIEKDKHLQKSALSRFEIDNFILFHAFNLGIL